MADRPCTTCGVIKPESAFPPTHRRMCRACKSAYDAAIVKRMRTNIVALLGGECVAPGCGITDVRMLTIDHVHGGGTQERKRLSASTYYKAMLSHLHDFQVLCWNHNHLKRLDNAEHGRARGRRETSPNPT